VAEIFMVMMDRIDMKNNFGIQLNIGDDDKLPNFFGCFSNSQRLPTFQKLFQLKNTVSKVGNLLICANLKCIQFLCGIYKKIFIYSLGLKI
jgi:hypothetical protein